MPRWLVLRLEAPMMSFGSVTVDHVGRSRDFPSASLLTGLIGNALGWKASDRTAHQQVQDRLIFAARIDREGTSLTETQNVQLGKSDCGWTTSGSPEGRKGSSYANFHRRRREYRTDSSVRVALTLTPEADLPTLDDVAAALERPGRPLFLGRKSCLPAAPILDDRGQRWLTASTAHDALCAIPGRTPALRAQWPVGQGPEFGARVDCVMDVADMRNWHTGLHGGARQVVEGRVYPRAGG